MTAISPEERAALASIAKINEQYLYQCLTGRRVMKAKEAVRVEKATGGRLRRWHVCKDWAETWPELIGLPGAPPVDTPMPSAPAPLVGEGANV